MPTDEQRVIRQLAKFLASLSEEDLKGLATGRRKLAVIDATAAKSRKDARSTVPRVEELRAVLDQLNAADSRDAGFALLKRDLQTKVALEALARHADLPVRREDTSESLRQKIVEATIGYRLRSQAIHGEQPHSHDDTATGT